MDNLEPLIPLAFLAVMFFLIWLVGGAPRPAGRKHKPGKPAHAGEVITIIDDHGQKRRAVLLDEPKKDENKPKPNFWKVGR